MKKVYRIIFIILSISCNEHKMPLEEGKEDLKKYLLFTYKGKYQIDSICPHFSQDLFKQQVGFKVWLIEDSKRRVGPIFFQKNKYQGGWITYGGTVLPLK